MSVDKSEKLLSIVASLIAIITAIAGGVAWVASSASDPLPAAKSEKVAGPQGQDKSEAIERSGPASDATEPFRVRAARLIRIVNVITLLFGILSIPTLLFAIAKWPPPETDWVDPIIVTTMFGPILLLLYGVLMLMVGVCSGVMDWTSTVILLASMPVLVVDLCLSIVVDKRNVNPDKLGFDERERHRTRYTRPS